MAKMDIKGSGNRGISFKGDERSSASIGGSGGVPVYIGARAVVTRETGGVKITLSDYKGTTEDTIAEAIQDILTNQDGSLTFVLPDGREITTDPLKSELPMYFGTTAEWTARTDLVSEQNAFYVWTDYKEIDGQYIAGMKLGDGMAYVVDLPFMDAQFQSHASNTDIHVTSEEKAFWNAKNRGMVVGENLILTEL